MIQRINTWRAEYDKRRKQHFIEDSNQYVSCRQFKFWRRGAFIGFVLLFIGTLGNGYVDRERAADGRQALVDSARVVVIDGCNRDFRNTERLRALLIRAEIAVKEQRDGGIISSDRYKDALAFYEQEIRLLELPDCRRARNVITDNPFVPVPNPPVPLYLGSPLATEEPARPG